MILIGQYDSPFVRRVGIALRLYGLEFEQVPLSVFGDAAATRGGGAGCLVREAGGLVMGALAACEHT